MAPMTLLAPFFPVAFALGTGIFQYHRFGTARFSVPPAFEILAPKYSGAKHEIGAGNEKGCSGLPMSIVPTGALFF